MPWFEVRTPRRKARLKLDGSFVVVGRSEQLPIFHDDPSLSRDHAALVVQGGKVRLKDLGSKNGVILNGKTVEKYAELPLQPGDVVQLGATVFTLRDGKMPEKKKKDKEQAKEAAQKPGDPTPAPKPPEGDAKLAPGDAPTSAEAAAPASPPSGPVSVIGPPPEAQAGGPLLESGEALIDDEGEAYSTGSAAIRLSDPPSGSSEDDGETAEFISAPEPEPS